MPTRYRRLNEILGLAVVALAGLGLLALASYAPTDPSLNTVGGYAIGSARPAHNYAGIVGAYLSDALLQLLGVAAFFLPLAVGRVGLCWLLARQAGSTVSRSIGLVLWLVFAPAAIGLAPYLFHKRALFRQTVPLEGATGRLLADAMVHFLNIPGAAVVLVLLVAISLYLATTFSFSTAREWATVRFAFLQALQDRWNNWRARHSRNADSEREVFESKRERMEALARRNREKQAVAARLVGADAVRAEPLPEEPTRETLLGSLFRWWSRRHVKADLHVVPETPPAPTPTSVWQAIPRTLVDAPEVTPFSTATAAAAPFADALARAAEPVAP